MCSATAKKGRMLLALSNLRLTTRTSYRRSEEKRGDVYSDHSSIRVCYREPPWGGVISALVSEYDAKTRRHRGQSHRKL